MSRDKRIALFVFLAGVALVVGYMLYATFLATPVVKPEEQAAVPPAVENAQIEITISGEANGVVVLDLYADLAPNHVERITTLARQGAYDGVVFHRVIEGFMAQTGDVQYGRIGEDMRMAGGGGSDLPNLAAEFSELEFVAGIVGMARSQDLDSANSQFFIMFDEGPFLNGKYTVIGKVATGFDVVQAIKRGAGRNGAVIGAPDVMQTVRVIE